MNWADIERVYLEASNVAPQDRTAFLNLACGDDAELRGEVEGLLKADAEYGSFLKAPPSRLAAQLLESSARHVSEIGNYQIVRVLGEGGMGTVYEAEQQKPRRTVALKVMKAGMAGEQMLRRFQQEAEALGRLQHPGIAQIYDAGTAEQGFGPQPYFAMELIDGRPILRYAEETKLHLRGKLELMAKVCDAVHHAHQRGILHRDLKPGNILVDQTGQPKILDFGVARVMDSDVQATRQTDLGQLIGTLAYMSPEQAGGDTHSLDIRSDVYALGVILYELLAGHLPYQTKGLALHEAVQTIQQQDPTSLSSINARYRGDVEVIVEKALEKDRDRRYGSAAELASDIRRHLADEPIAARPASATYQLKKFTRRNRALVVGTAAVLAALIGGVIVSTYQAVRAREAERQATLGQELARKQSRLAQQERDRALAAEKRAELEKDRALAAQKLANQEKARATQAATNAEAIRSFLGSDIIAQASGYNPYGPEVPIDPDLKVRTALERASKGVSVWSVRYGKQPEVEANIRATIAYTYGDMGLYREAIPHLKRALEAKVRAFGPNDVDTLKMQQRLGLMLRRAGMLNEAETILKKTWVAQIHVLGRRHFDSLETEYGLAGIGLDSGEYREGIALGEEVLSGQRRLVGPEDEYTMRSLQNVSLCYLRVGQFAKAEAGLRLALDICDRRFPPERLVRVLSMQALAAALLEEGRTQEAESLDRKCVETEQRMRGSDNPFTLAASSDVAFATEVLGRHSEAEASLRDVLERQVRALGPEHPKTLATADRLGYSLFQQGKYTESEKAFANNLEIYRRVMGQESAFTTAAAVRLARSYLAQGNFAAAEPVAREAMQTDQKVRLEHPAGFWAESVLGASLLGQKRFAEAEPHLLSGFGGMEVRKDRIVA